MTTENKIDKVYDDLFEFIMNEEGDNIYDLIVEYSDLDGKTIRRSWRDREKALKDVEGGI